MFPGSSGVAPALHGWLEHAARTWPDKVAVQEGCDASISYGDLTRLSDRLCERLTRLGVRPGDRVGLCLRKSIDAVAAIFGTLKAGAAYVPVDPYAPIPRSAYIFSDCSVAAVIVEARFEEALRAELARLSATCEILSVGEVGGGLALEAALDNGDQREAAGETVLSTDPDSLAFILYTSGSTGKPKGVQLTHRNAASFVDWCSTTFRPVTEDRFSSHAPFHFDLSVFDIYCSMKHGGTLILIDEEAGKQPGELARLIADARISIWYSTPSILGLMAHVDLRDYDHSSLRLVLFAGEVFPLAHLKLLTSSWPHPRYFNLYGPTETNVCTWHEVRLPMPIDRTKPIPIGRICEQFEGIVIDPEGNPVASGEPGELCIRGPGVTAGYWNLPEQTSRSFVSVGPGASYYRTGDIVSENADGDLDYLGRRDRMVKKRGFRIELGEIEACLYRHAAVSEAAVVSNTDDAAGVRIIAHVATGEGKLSIVALKIFCSKHLPAYMIPDIFIFHPALPRTSTDKVDYQALKQA